MMIRTSEEGTLLTFDQRGTSSGPSDVFPMNKEFERARGKHYIPKRMIVSKRSRLISRRFREGTRTCDRSRLNSSLQKYDTHCPLSVPETAMQPFVELDAVRNSGTQART
jgi:hypothetical protein